MLSPTQKTAIVRESPYKRNYKEVKEITRRRGSRDSPQISDSDEQMQPYGRAADYEIG